MICISFIGDYTHPRGIVHRQAWALFSEGVVEPQVVGTLAEVEKVALDVAYEEGYEAATRGLQCVNPYKHDRHLESAWRHGWMQRRDDVR